MMMMMMMMMMIMIIMMWSMRILTIKNWGLGNYPRGKEHQFNHKETDQPLFLLTCTRHFGKLFVLLVYTSMTYTIDNAFIKSKTRLEQTFVG